MSETIKAEASFKAEFVAALDAGDLPRAIVAARTLLGTMPRLHLLSFVRKAIDRLPAAPAGLLTLRVALLSSFSSEFVHDALHALAFLDGIRLQILQPGFAQFRQEILNAHSSIYQDGMDVVVLAVEGKDFVPLLYGNDLGSTQQQVEQSVAEAGQELAALIRTFRERSGTTLLVHNFAIPRIRPLGILDGQIGRSSSELIHDLNQALYRTTRVVTNAYIVDYARLIQRHGAGSWYDSRMEYYASLPIAQTKLPVLAGEYLKYLRALTGKCKKCVVLDLDNTLWGGVVGEEGVDGIQLGTTYPGNAYLAFQEALLGLQRRGIILAVASKNNPADVDEVFARHPALLLKKEHFSQMQVHWRPKSESIEALARELNLSLEHIVFIDDNPVECAEVSLALPMVNVLCLRERPEDFAEALLESGWFDTLSISNEDKRRGELYKQRDEAEQLRSRSVSIEDFYRRLDLEATFAPVEQGTLGRAAQLTQKTNQFNATTFRYTEAHIAQRLADTNWVVVNVSVRDCFGDNGVVGLIMAELNGDELVVDTFVMSCRVIGRTLETAMLAHLCEQAERFGAHGLRGRIIPTAKNGPVRELYESHGFELISDQTWRLQLDRGRIGFPPWFKINDQTVVVDA
jgi:FkbH-like protein